MPSLIPTQADRSRQPARAATARRTGTITTSGKATHSDREESTGREARSAANGFGSTLPRSEDAMSASAATCPSFQDGDVSGIG